MQFYILHPDRVHQKMRPHWTGQKPGTWHAGVDLPPGLYWHPREYRGLTHRDLPVVPGEQLALVAVLTNDRPKLYHGLPLRMLRDRVRVLRRVKLTKEYTYQEMYQSPLYRQWRKEGRLHAYNFQAFPQTCHSRHVRKHKTVR